MHLLTLLLSVFGAKGKPFRKVSWALWRWVMGRFGCPNCTSIGTDILWHTFSISSKATVQKKARSSKQQTVTMYHGSQDQEGSSHAKKGSQDQEQGRLFIIEDILVVVSVHVIASWNYPRRRSCILVSISI